MTERITHAEVLRLFEGLDGYWSAVDSIRGYVAQQQALEADTVSRAELNEANAAWHERWMRDQKLIEKLNHDSVEATEQLTALQAELETEKAAVRCYMADLETARARAEEAERSAGEQLGLRLDLTKELAAANARVARLEEAVSEVLSVHGFLGVDASGREEQHDSMLLLREVALSTAPQASTEQTDDEDDDEERDPLTGQLVSARVGYHPAQPAPSPAACWPGAGFIVRVTSSGRDTAVREPAQPAPGGTGRHWSDCSDCTRDGGYCARHPSLRVGIPPFTSPQVAQAAVKVSVDGTWCATHRPHSERPLPAQPAPGGTERHSLNEYTVCRKCRRFDPSGPCPGPADPAPAEPQDRPDISECPKRGGTYTDEHEGPLCPPCDYVEEQGRPEQAGECPPGFRQIPVYSDSRGTLSMGLGGLTTIRACQHCGVLIAGGPTACVHCVRVADRLESK